MDPRLAATEVLGGFKQFILRGNVVDLAVGVIIGASFGAVVNSAVKDLIMPLIAAVWSLPDFSTFAFTVRGSHIAFGGFLNAILAFFIQATAIYFMIVLPVNSLMSRVKKTPDPTTAKCPECLSEIPLAARRCSHCGQLVAGAV